MSTSSVPRAVPEDAPTVDVVLVPKQNQHERNSSSSSMLYNVLPLAFQSRIPRLPSFRRSITELGGRRSQHKMNNSIFDMPRPETPPPEYRSREGSGSNTPERRPLSVDEAQLDTSDDDSDADTPVVTAAIPRSIPVYEGTTGVNWGYARHGIRMLNQVRQLAREPFRERTESDNSLLRDLYVQSVALLIRGLPSDLTPPETLTLQASLPASMANTDGQIGALVLRSQGGDIAVNDPSAPPTLLHRATAGIIFYILIMVNILLPYIRLFIGRAYEFEKEHRLSRRFLDSSITTMDGLSRGGARVAQNICQWNDGMVSDTLNRVVLYSATGVSGGVQQGIRDAIRAGAFTGRNL